MEKKIESLKSCCGCQVCKNICPTQSIRMIKKKDGFIYPSINKNSCINCDKCDNMCPIINFKKNQNYVQRKAYLAYSFNKEDLLLSSSGAMFPVIAKKIIEANGIVIGAAYNGKNLVEHKVIENVNDLSKIQGSKYIQSNIKDNYLIAENALKKGKYVLFSGTPCQIAGLKFYLKKDYDKLITQDIICHGVPSERIYKEYLKYLENKYHSKIVYINQRDKSTGWDNYSVKVVFSNGKIYKEYFTDDYFMRIYLSDKILRYSCYDCKYKGDNRLSDITLADFWNVNKVIPKIENTNEGISLIIVHTDKGERFINEIKNEAFIEPVNKSEALKFNISYYENAKQSDFNHQIFDDLEKIKFDKLVKKYTKPLVKRNLLSKIKKIIKKVK